MKKLLWDEFSNVNRAVKTMQEILYKQKTIAYTQALETAMRIYDDERNIRRLEKEPLALTLDMMGTAAKQEKISLAPFADPVSAILFQINRAIQSSLIVKDPLGSKTETWMRQWIEQQILRSPVHAKPTFLQLIEAFNQKAKTFSDASSEHLGMVPIRVKFADDLSVRFESRRAWAAFVSRSDVWKSLPYAPSLPYEMQHVRKPSVGVSMPASGTFVSTVFRLANETNTKDAAAAGGGGGSAGASRGFGSPRREL